MILQETETAPFITPGVID